MRASPSQYGGIAAVMVLGVSLLIVGFNMLPEQQARAMELRWAGVVVSVLGLLLMAIMFSPTAALKVLSVVIGAAIFCGTFVYFAATNELTGTATYHDFSGKGDTGELVTRESSPVKFRLATNLLWGGSGLCFGIAVASFVAYRKLDE